MLIRWIHDRPVIVFKSGISVHSFNTPYQLAHIPSNLDREAFIHDTSSDALYYSLKIEAGDLLIMGTDGLWDNIYPRELMGILGGEKRMSQGIAERIGERAYRNSKADKAGPFQDAIQQAYPLIEWKGGKEDDITVLAAWVVALS
jgi:protein phosphatase PTC7